VEEGAVVEVASSALMKLWSRLPLTELKAWVWDRIKLEAIFRVSLELTDPEQHSRAILRKIIKLKSEF
jgi:hypothetical protein